MKRIALTLTLLAVLCVPVSAGIIWTPDQCPEGVCPPCPQGEICTMGMQSEQSLITPAEPDLFSQVITSFTLNLVSFI